MFWNEKAREPSILSNTSRGFSKYAVGCTVVTVCVLIGFGAWGYTWSRQFKNRVAPNVSIGSIDASGKTADELRTLLQMTDDNLLTRGIDVQLNGQTKTVPLATLVGSDSVENVTIDVEQTVQTVIAANHHNNRFADAYVLLIGVFRPTSLPVLFKMQNHAIVDSLHTVFSSQESQAEDTSFEISSSGTEWIVEAKQGTDGMEIDTKSFLTTLNEQISRLQFTPIELSLVAKSPSISATQAETAIPSVKKILQAAPYPFTFKEDDGTETRWPLSARTLSTMLIPLADGTVGLNQEAFETFIRPIADSINRPAKNARFQIAGNRVSEFMQNEDGRFIDEPRLFQDVLRLISTISTNPPTGEEINDRTSASNAIAIVMQIQKSEVSTASVNNLGITDKLGVGISSYKGSPKNRQKNIQNGVNLLNGLLIAPGDTFSLIAALQPFTKTNGYLPELVIKGNTIKPEIGGGLCQIGTTAFRATMNAGLPVIERSNHSLAVSYYNDPSNNNPGTDATIYEPAPDFKLQNDTGHYILLETENLIDKQELRFTFWGTSDGRKGSYTPPIVLRRIPVGVQITTETPNLKHGEETCQAAHVGADATFTYSVAHTDGTIVKKVFTSHYRPLPKICLVGVDPTKVMPTDAPINFPTP